MPNLYPDPKPYRIIVVRELSTLLVFETLLTTAYFDMRAFGQVHSMNPESCVLYLTLFRLLPASRAA